MEIISVCWNFYALFSKYEVNPDKKKGREIENTVLLEVN